MNIGYFGVTGNPPHLGHKDVVKNSLQEFDEVWVSPVFEHPFGKSMLPYKDRFEMTRRTFEGMSGVKVLNLDMIFVNQTGLPAFTYNILSYCKNTFGISPRFIIGEDNAKEEVWSKFKLGKELKEEFGLYVVKDEGVHSTPIRELVKKQQWSEVSKYCDPSVVQYIKENKFYQD